MIRRLLNYFREDETLDFPNKEPRGRVHFDGEFTTAELVRATAWPDDLRTHRVAQSAQVIPIETRRVAR